MCAPIATSKIWGQRFKHITQKLSDVLPLRPLYLQFFVKRRKFLAATSKLCVEQNLVHLGRFLHFSQKVVGVNLTCVFSFV